jgi:hypothetical protein
MNSHYNGSCLFLKVVKPLRFTYNYTGLVSAAASFVKVTRGICSVTGTPYMVISAAYVYAPLMDILDLDFRIAVPFSASMPLPEDFYVGYVTERSLCTYFADVLLHQGKNIYAEQCANKPGWGYKGRRHTGRKAGRWPIAGDLLDSCEYENVSTFYKLDFNILPFQWFSFDRHEHNAIKYEQKY